MHQKSSRRLTEAQGEASPLEFLIKRAGVWPENLQFNQFSGGAHVAGFETTLS